MNPFDYIKALDHHAYFIHSFKDVINNLKKHLEEKFNIKHNQNPDFFHEKFETLGIDDSRKIKENHLSKSFSDKNKRIFIIESSNITHEAQNSLLKIFEEPNSNNVFFLIMPSINVLLPTLRSRLYIIYNKDNNTKSDQFKIAEDFLKLDKKEKIDFVDEISKDISDEKIERIYAMEFLNALEIILYNKGEINNVNALKAIIKTKSYLNDRSPSIKQLLEYVALSL